MTDRNREKLFSRSGLAYKIFLLCGFSLFLALIFLQTHFFLKQRELTRRSHEWVVHTSVVLQDINRLVMLIRETESDVRGYLLTNNKDYLFSHVTKNNRINRHDLNDVLLRLKRLTNDNKQQQDAVKRLQHLIEQKMSHLDRVLDLYRKNGQESILSMAPKGKGKQLMEQIDYVVAHMIKRERELFINRQENYSARENTFSNSLLAAAVVTYGILLITIALVVYNSLRLHRIERDNRAKDAYLRAAMNGAMDAMFIFNFKKNRKGLFLDYLNPAAQKVFHMQPHDVMGQGIENVLKNFCGDQFSNLQDYLNAACHGLSSERDYQSTEGATKGRHFQLQITPVDSGVFISLRDVTERKVVETMKNEFVSTVSHELRTPLTSIRGSLGLVTGGMAGPVPDQVSRLLDIAYNNCERLIRLINDILDIEKIEAGHTVLDIKPVSLEMMLAQALDQNKGFADKYGVKLQLLYDVNEGNQSIMADHDRILQVLTNLLSNAVKFSPENGVVTLSCRVKKNFAYISVADEGKGIDKAFQPHVFGKFAQADSSDTRQKGGTGLGLNISKALIEQMNGKIGFTSELNVGTTFYFTLPLSQTSNFILPQFGNSERKILVCEDDADIANFLKIILERDGFDVDLACDAMTAKNCLEKYTYMAMTLDLILPDKDGISFIRELRAIPRHMDLPIIVVSAKAEEGRKKLNGDAIGILDWISKPIDVARLINIVRTLSPTERRACILHVEDDHDIAQILRLALTPVADIVWTDHYHKAVDLIRSRHFDLAVLDIGLPDGKGTDLLPLLGGERPVPVILFTAAEISKDVSKSVHFSLTKSKTSEQKLLSTIRGVLESQARGCA